MKKKLLIGAILATLPLTGGYAMDNDRPDNKTNSSARPPAPKPKAKPNPSSSLGFVPGGKPMYLD